MADRAHIRFVDPDWTVIRKYNEERGWLSLEGGERTSPPVIGYVNGNDRVVAINIVPNDTSTGTDILRTVDETVTDTAVTRTVTIRDLTAQEIADRGTNIVNERFQSIKDDALHDAIRDILHRYNNSIRTLEGKATWTKSEFNDWFKTFIQSSVDGGAT